MAVKTFKTIIVDDNEENIFDLHEHLFKYPEIEIVGQATQYAKAKKLILQLKPDLLFLDIEMPCKNGFEFYSEIKAEIKTPINVVFYTAYDKYMIEALRQSAFDYLLKPVKPDELKLVVERLKSVKGSAPMPAPNPFLATVSNMVPLPVNTGLRFVPLCSIVLVQCTKHDLFEKPIWEVQLSHNEKLKLRNGITAEYLMNLLGTQLFIKLNKALLVNRNFISIIEYKTRCCYLIPPFNNESYSISRQQLVTVREEFDVL